MNEPLEPVIKIEKKGDINGKELFGKLKEFIEKEPLEYPSFALTSLMIDSFTSGASILKTTKELPQAKLQEKFVKA